MQTSAQPQILGQKLFTVPIARLKTKDGRRSESSACLIFVTSHFDVILMLHLSLILIHIYKHSLK